MAQLQKQCSNRSAAEAIPWFQSSVQVWVVTGAKLVVVPAVVLVVLVVGRVVVVLVVITTVVVLVVGAMVVVVVVGAGVLVVDVVRAVVVVLVVAFPGLHLCDAAL